MADKVINQANLDKPSIAALAAPANDSAYSALRMSSREIADLTDKRHDHVMRDIENMLATLGDTSPQFWGDLPDSYNRPQRVAFLPKRETLILVSGYSIALRAKIIDRWQELEAAAARPLTQIEVLLQSVQVLANVERQQRDQATALVRIGEKLDQIETTQLLKECPSNAEPITRIRARIAQRHGLSSRVVDHVMRQHPQAPKPAGMVRNDREEANGATYAVYWVKDVTAIFDSFVKSSTPVLGTIAQFTNTYYDGRFTLRSKAA